jgi:hypothetical protein
MSLLTRWCWYTTLAVFAAAPSAETNTAFAQSAATTNLQTGAPSNPQSRSRSGVSIPTCPPGTG